MDVKDYSQKLNQAREKFSTAQDDLRSSYAKSTDDMKETFDNKLLKQSKNYETQKSKLEENNLINNEMYSDKTKKTIAERQETFRNDIKKNSDKFDSDRKNMKSEFNDKLNNLSDSYKKSTEENDRYHDQAKKTMGERYSKANKVYKNDFDNKIDNLTSLSKQDLTRQKDDFKKDSQTEAQKNQANLEDLRLTSEEQKFKEVSRLRNDNESLRTNFDQERNTMQQQKDARISDIMKSKNEENEEGQKNFSNLQQNIRQKSLAEEERTKVNHQNEAKALEKKFNDDLRNVQQVANQKIKGGTELSTIKDENKQLINSYENKLQDARSDAKLNSEKSSEKEKEIDSTYRDKIKSLKLSNAEDLEKHDSDLNNQHKKTFQEVKDKNETAISRYKTDAVRSKANSDDALTKSELKSKGQLTNQRVEFGRLINTVNSKKMEEISTIKEESNKDKNEFIEKSKKDFSEEKMTMKDEFNHQSAIKEDLYEQKLVEMEKQTNKIIDNYEKKIGQIARKAENEVENIKISEMARARKERQAFKLSSEAEAIQHKMELGNTREKYERIIGKDRQLNEQQMNRIVQKYEDQLVRERSVAQKESAMKLGEAEAKFERLFHASTLEKETLRNQYEERIENMKLGNVSEDANSKKA